MLSNSSFEQRPQRRGGRRFSVGAEVSDAGVSFRVWAPKRRRVTVLIDGVAHALVACERGYFETVVRDVGAGTTYAFALDDDDTPVPDPASRFQPHGPHGPSCVVDPRAFTWRDAAWPGCTIKGQVLYEMHIGTITPQGTYAAAMDKLAAIADIGVTCIEVMPLNEFDGDFGWGYDGVDWFAPSHLYGTPDDLRRFVDTAHGLGLGVILDVVYNHLGPSGNCLPCFSDGYYSKRYDTAWGGGINFDDDAGAVRDYVLDNVRHWIEEYHFDGLRIDATQDIHDTSREHILAAISRTARQAAAPRSVIIVGENEPQDGCLVRPLKQHGFGFDALWNDDFHHSVIVAAVGRREAYYTDYTGSAQELVSLAKWGYLFQGQRYSWQDKRRGGTCLDLPPYAFVNFLQNHDQVANSMRGLRLSALTAPGRLRALTALTLLAPGTPLLIQGQEFAASSPFFYFADHDADLTAIVSAGRRTFLTQFESLATAEAQAALPEIGAESFHRSVLDWRERDQNTWAVALHTDLLRLRRTDPTFSAQSPRGVDGAVLAPECFVLRFFGVEEGAPIPGHHDDRLLLVNLGPDRHLTPAPEPLLGITPHLRWALMWSSESVCYGGSGMPEPDDDAKGWRIMGHSAAVLKAIPRHDAADPSQGVK